MQRANVPTSSIPFVETAHGRMRREQRGIHKKDLQRARKWGTRESSHSRPNGNPTAIYRYKDITYIVDEYTHEEVTSYAVPLTLDPVPLTASAASSHRVAKQQNQKHRSRWTSNTVLVVDTSGSMKQGDVWGTRDRLGAIWVSIALDFLADRLESGNAKVTDVVSVITLEMEPRFVVYEEPTTWTLYNKIVDIYSNKTVQPRGHGPFVPALEAALDLLLSNSDASCAMALLFLSDGKPSDAALTRGIPKEEWTSQIVGKVESLAKRLGRRLTFKAIGIGDMDNFDTLEEMVEGAKDFGAISTFSNPSKNSQAIGEVFTALSSTLTATQTEMTNVETMKQHRVKSVIRESQKKASQSTWYVSEDDFYLYPAHRVERLTYKEETGEKGARWKVFKPTSLQHHRAKTVALAKGPFGEGAERFAYRFYELASDMTTIVGPPYVAKESRLLLQEGLVDDEDERWKFVKKFCSTQQLALRFAKAFNATLSTTRRVHRSTPRIAFLDCSVYKLDDKKLGKLSVLVEEKLDHEKWYKWNANNGYVEGMARAPDLSEEHIENALENFDLGIIEEGSEDEEEESEEEDDNHRENPPICFTASQVAQAFSHYTYLASGKRRVVCDLQGVFDSNVLRLSDPVIHYRSNSGKRFVHGRTDKGMKGIKMFFATHHEHCGHLCRLVNRRFYARERIRRRHKTSLRLPSKLAY